MLYVKFEMGRVTVNGQMLHYLTNQRDSHLMDYRPIAMLKNNISLPSATCF